MTLADPLVAARRRPRAWRSLASSLLFHGLLVVLACWVVLRTPTRPTPAKEFVAHAVSGGRSGAPASVHPIQRKPKVVLPAKRLVSKSATATLALPPMKSLTPEVGLAGLTAGQGKGGFGRGFGSFGGNGLGAGLGNRAGFVGRPVMGAFIRAQRVAVYLDCSGSMRSYLPRVEAEIRKQFPDADVFRFDGARVVGLGDKVVHGRGFHGPAPRLREGPTQTAVETLTPAGRLVQAKVRTACEKGSLGAWMDRLLAEPYDALVVFSDFQDGVRQIRTKAIGNVAAYKPDKGMRADPPVVFSDRTNQGGGFARSVTLIASGGGSGQNVVQCKDTSGLIVGMVALGSGIPPGTTVTEIKENVSFTLSKPLTALASGRITCNNGGDKRFPEERKWEEEWEKAFAGARANKGPRLYLISTARAYGNKPGTIFQRCVAASEGSAIMVKFGNGKKGGNTVNDLHNYDDLYVGMPVSGRGVPDGAVLTAMPTFKNIVDPEDPEKKRMKRVVDKQLTISVPLTEDSLGAVFAFTPLIQAVGTLAKDSKTIEDVSGSIDLRSGMQIQDTRFPAGTKVVAVAPNKASPGFFTVEMSAPASAAGANVVLRFRPAGSGAGGSRSAAPTR
jgi:hypothetical protein